MRALSSDVWIKTAVNIYIYIYIFFFFLEGDHTRFDICGLTEKAVKVRAGSVISSETLCLGPCLWVLMKTEQLSIPGGRALPYIMVFVPFRSENGCRFCSFWSGIGYAFRGNYGSVWTYLSFQFQMNQRERVICEFQMDCWVTFLLAQIKG